ncbi:putative leucine-rich repeat domain superfamily [Helianthus annuus]|nr:putative leucine-rich repeat domain superfamily [Helianthus annuus]
MKNMLSTPDFYGLPCLQKLTLHKCKELQEVHPSLGCHKSLEYVRVLYCYKLRKFPTIVQMGKLKTLTIQYCNDSLEFPEIKSNMESLVRLSLRDMRIDVLLSSIGERCVNLVSLDLANCSSLKSTEVDFDGLKYLEAFTLNGLTHSKTRDKLFISWLVGKVGCGKDWYRSQPSISLWLTRSLTKLYISDCGLRDGEIPSNIGELYSLQELHLGWNDFTQLDISLLQLTQLKLLILDVCKHLVKLPELPAGIYILYADNCHSLKAIGDFHKKCKRLCRVSLINGCIIIDGDRLLESMLQVCISVCVCFNMKRKPYGVEL